MSGKRKKKLAVVVDHRPGARHRHHVRGDEGERARSRKPKLPVKVGKAEVADIQVKVTEVGNVQPEVKVDVKSVVSGKVVEILASRRRFGEARRDAGARRARSQPGAVARRRQERADRVEDPLRPGQEKLRIGSQPLRVRPPGRQAESRHRDRVSRGEAGVREGRGEVQHRREAAASPSRRPRTSSRARTSSRRWTASC